jgi:hypothetical protein
LGTATALSTSTAEYSLSGVRTARVREPKSWQILENLQSIETCRNTTLDFRVDIRAFVKSPRFPDD